MMSLTGTAHLTGIDDPEMRRAVVHRNLLVTTIASLSLIDIFDGQSILLTLTERYSVGPYAMGVAIIASTFGMAITFLAAVVFTSGTDRSCTV